MIVHIAQLFSYGRVPAFMHLSAWAVAAAVVLGAAFFQLIRLAERRL